MSDNYIVSARKYRPSTFRTVVGQKSLTSTLKNAISSGRLAQAYLFTGPRGVGKTSCARIFAKTINCLSPTADGEACGECESCRAIDSGDSYNIIELDAASNNSVNDIRMLTEQVNVPPQLGNYRVFIIDEVHMLSSAAFNAFLKTLEEPPKYVVFILATTEKQKVLPTILSRCQIYDFRRITIADMVEHLRYVADQEGITAESEALNVIARKADGAMRDALSIFDQVAASCRGNITYASAIASLNVLDYDYYFRLIECFRSGDVPGSLLIYKEIRDKGFDSLFFVNGLASHVRDLMVSADERTLPLLEVADDVAAKYHEQARSLPVQWYYAALKLLNDCDYTYRTATGKQLLVELTLIRLCQLLNPPTPPFDRVDQNIPLKPVTAPQAPSPAPQPAAPQPAAIAQQQTPAPQPAAQPVRQTAPSDTSRSAAAPRPASRQATHAAPRAAGMHTMRISEMKVTAEASQQTRKRNPVTREAMLDAWAAYQTGHSDTPLLIAAMQKSNPAQTGPESFSIEVNHPAAKQSFENAMPELIGFLRNRLENDFVTLEVTISEAETVKRLPPAELLKKITQENPVIAQMLGDLDAEME